MPTLIRIYYTFFLVFLFSCTSYPTLVLDETNFQNSTLNAVLDGKTFTIPQESYIAIRSLMLSKNPKYRRAGLILAEQTAKPFFYTDIVARILDSNVTIAMMAREIIAKNPQQYRPVLLQELENTNSLVRSSVMDLLSKIAGEDLIPVFIRFFADPDADVRKYASLAVSAVTSRSNPFFQDALVSENPRIVATAYQTLGWFAHPQDAPILIAAFTSPNPLIRKEVQLAAFRLGEKGLPFFHKEATDTERPLDSRMVSLNVIQGVRSVKSLTTLFKLLKDTDSSIRGKTNSILKTYGAESVPALKELYESMNEEYRILAVQLMGTIQATECLPLLAMALGNSSKAVRAAAVTSMESFGTEAWPVLQELLGPVKTIAANEATQILRRGNDIRLIQEAPGGPINSNGVFQLITCTNEEDINTYLETTTIDKLTKETILSLKKAWMSIEEFAAIEAQILSGQDLYLYNWRQQEIATAESNKALQKSFNFVHRYFDTKDAQDLNRASTLRTQSRHLKEEAQEYRTLLNSMSTQEQENGQLRLKRYRELYVQMMQTWKYLNPEMRNIAMALYKDRNLDPQILAQEWAILD